ncbi:MAG: ATP/GTP-binding protein [Corynebacterium casei]|uniref:ATP/GTP-binding protein n=1 Tax=Corynebacterium sp. TaxID=1720 RepID=UPI0026483EF8|nr:ATP/GTP-binding protein [Corynebacterium sp.]MDN6130463.1 ATP/GTP-binding protein [Corynebacterium casei]MDN6154703.1 ATP/GTP-binding protein [Corynebacterium casei]MDN6737494.1 ATP/GTP-binding protein [Corynebacterium sp.]
MTTTIAHDDMAMAVLHQEILDGEAEAPPRFSKRGRAYKRWLKNSKKYADSLDRQRRRAGGVVPVRKERPFGAMRPRGFTGRNSGYAAVQSGPPEWQTTTNLGCGFNPNVVGAAAPVVGTPLGRHVTTGAEVACDPLAWFREGIIANPSCFVLSLPGLGKSTLIRKMLMGGVASGHIPIMAGDIKGEYVGFTQQVGGQVIKIGHGFGHLNPLDVGALGRVIPLLEEHQDDPSVAEAINTAKEQIHGRQVTMVSTLVSLGRGGPIRDYEAMLVAAALREIYESETIDWLNPPILQDLIDYLERGSENLRIKGRARNEEQWNERIDALVLSLNSLLDGQTGRIFSGQTTTPIEVDSPAVCIDVSAVDRGDSAMKAAVMMACWGNAFGAIEAAHMLSDAGLAPQRYFSVTLDEMWQVLSSAPGMVGQIDSLTRLNRTDATSLQMITHTFKDLEALPTEEDRKTAMGFIERAGMVICGGLPASELDVLSHQLEFSPAEAAMIISWSKGAPPKRARTRGSRATPPGRGRFMIKPSKDGSPGIPVKTELFTSEIEHRLHDTNARFDDFFAEGSVA